MLFAWEFGGMPPVERVIATFWRETPGDPEGRDYADEIVRGVLGDVAAIDGIVTKASTNWRMERMARVDRNVLRIGAWELSQQRSIPRAVVLNESVELAKRFGSEESGAFINGVLEGAANALGRSDSDR